MNNHTFRVNIHKFLFPHISIRHVQTLINHIPFVKNMLACHKVSSCLLKTLKMTLMFKALRRDKFAEKRMGSRYQEHKPNDVKIMKISNK